MRARVAAASAAATAGSEPRPSSASPGNAARSMSSARAPRAARRAAAAGLRLSPSALVLVAANLVPLAGVLFFGWSVFATLLLFWVENVIVGGFNVLRMLWAQPDNPLIWVAKAGTIPFFIFHYGMFTTVHGVFVLTLFGGVHERGFPGPTEFFHAVRAAGIWPAALA